MIELPLVLAAFLVLVAGSETRRRELCFKPVDARRGQVRGHAHR